MSPTSEKSVSASSRLVQVLGGLSWLVLICAGFLYFMARPETETFLDRHWDKVVRTTWDLERARLGLTLLKANLALTGGGFLLNLALPAGTRRLSLAIILAGLVTLVSYLSYPHLS